MPDNPITTRARFVIKDGAAQQVEALRQEIEAQARNLGLSNFKISISPGNNDLELNATAGNYEEFHTAIQKMGPIFARLEQFAGRQTFDVYGQVPNEMQVALGTVDATFHSELPLPAPQ